MRKNTVVNILQKEERTSNDLNFLDHYITTYLPDLSKKLKGKFQKEAYEKIYNNFKYQKKSAGEVVFDKKECNQATYFVLTGKITWNGIKESSSEGSEPEKEVLSTYEKNGIIYPETISIDESQKKYSDYNCTCAEDSEIVSIDAAFCDKISKEYEDQAKTAKIKSLSKVFSRFKKLDKSSKENFLKYFREDKLTKGTIVIKAKSKVEEIYTIQQGKVALVQKNQFNPNYKNEYIIFGILDKDTAFNEYPLVLEKENPYNVICVEEVSVLVLDKNNFGFVADNDTSNDLRANASCKERLQNIVLDKFNNLSQKEAEAHQQKFLKTLGVEYKDIEQIFSKKNPKNTQSNQFLKNLDKFNAAVGKPAAQTSDPKNKFSEFATPRLVSKDPRFAALDPQRQLSLMALRNEGLNRRSGDTATTTTSIMKNPEQLKNVQKSLLMEERGGVEKLINRKNVSEAKSIGVEEESKGSTGTSAGTGEGAKPTAGGLLGKFAKKNDELLAKIKPNSREEVDGEKTETTASEGKDELGKNIDNEASSVKFDKKVEDGDKFGLELTKRNLVKPQPAADNITKKRLNLLGKPGMI
eukprot:CAMPEP_0176428086 /NCGR_PEP_ID=MMETSP0127-20121128/12951_1 /TAXON_ID=938130 /ORGANISM="Platyophrya macrostoma, Strain WH" /LENGTH=581 /DNA_ID=CAMNT_0017809723 /DNA_START=90 /DNA_END=1835 /DNA_ORIENTATION=+